jgi:hypothetical protein
MIGLKDVYRSPHILGDSPGRRVLPLAVVGLDVGLSFGWIVLAFGIAIVAGFLGAGLVPTVGSLWLVGLWWFVFPPLVGYLTGSWAGTTRYNHPRILGYAYETARAELVGGIEYGIEFGLLFAIVLGLVGYATGMGTDWLSTRMNNAR